MKMRIELTNNLVLERSKVVLSLAQSAEYLRSRLVRNTPSATGVSRAAWTSQVDPAGLRAFIRNNKGYLAYVDEGTGLWGPSRRKYPIKPKYKKALAWPNGDARTTAGLGRGPQGTKKGTGYKSFTVVKSVMHPGIRPRHFVKKSIDESRSRVLTIFNSNLKK